MENPFSNNPFSNTCWYMYMYCNIYTTETHPSEGGREGGREEVVRKGRGGEGGQERD